MAAQLSDGILKQGGTAEIQVQCSGSQDARIVEVPEVEGLIIGPPSNPMRREYRYSSRGRLVTSIDMTWSVPVRATQLGNFTIPPLTLEVGGQRVETPELNLRVVRDLKGEALGFFEVSPPPRRVYEGEPYDLEFTFGWDAELTIQEIALHLPWWKRQRGVLEGEEQQASLGGRMHRIEVNGAYRTLVEELRPTSRKDRPHRTCRLKRRYTATRPGKLEFPRSYFEFARAEQAEPTTSFFQRQRLERFYVPLEAFEIEVLAIPEEGQPFDWTGAVGNLSADRNFDRRDVDVGDSIKLSVVWRGRANLEFFEAPDLARLDAFDGFKVLGQEDVFMTDERIVTYDLVPTTSELREIPPVPLWVFDTELEEYRRVETEPVPIRVRAIAGEEGLEAAGERGPVFDIEDIRTAVAEDSSAQAPEPLGPAALFGSFAATLLGWGALRTLVRRRLGDPDGPAARRRRAAARALKSGLARATGPAQEAACLHAFLAARTREAEQAWVGRNPIEWGEQQGASESLRAALSRLRQVQADLDASAYGGAGGARPGAQEILNVSRDLLKGGL